MKETLSLAVTTRTGLGKGANRKLRAKDMVPGIYYDATGANVPVMVEHLPLQKLYAKTASSHVFDLKIATDAGEETKPSLMWKVEHHPTKPRITHVDFYGVDLTKAIHVHIPVVVTGKAKGQVKGGALEVYRESIEVVCLPLAIPDRVVIDITNLDVNESVQVADLVLPEGVKAVYEDNFSLLAVVIETEDQGEETAAAEEPAAEAEA
ncbi:ribosomal 5S rRNA E-loop binding protein Ctc/L25/TL5 [Solidesulfovibrio fructosivorans JJ]]|uniref:Large ribosomal subunit protein bL25 n=1 Tax=Solidesulfovibrio fructosivorans JJ] TaxID=596151 RepID=E1JUC6_SOLFR|nr:50S ribosomal protein L25/general stress protein Ctc [Solidesulfovibrio fructosivorans]EFL52056.1 ribosomal 5S rRNA E-loop binding protein Ctc/L25/TL5 [Solidesulfovibrio fructosivorans JJ]]